MKTKTKDSIIEYIKKQGKARAHDLIIQFHISNVAIHKQLSRLIKTGTLSKIGRPPLVYYVLNTGYQQSAIHVVKEIKKKIDDSYLYISPLGETIYGFEGFVSWARATHQQNIPQLVTEYIKTREKANNYFNSLNWIDATKRLHSMYKKDTFVNKLIYQDFYSLPKFGKTKLGQMMLYAKQSQNLDLIHLIVKETKATIGKIIKKYSIDTIAFIPPTIPRVTQFMKEYEKLLQLHTRTMKIDKIRRGEIIIAQKSLTKLEERIVNARETIYPKLSNSVAHHLLLIDDAVGSGATINETAKKLRSDGLVKNTIIAYGIVGSYKGFDVIREI